MGNRYYGDFRSIDTSVDPNGQRYRAVILTGFDGGNPYPTYSYTYPQTQTTINIPATGVEVTMADNPFTVTYEGDTENIYKPYRCSTATVCFRQSNINLNFINSNGTSTLVLLLKWKNEVVNDGNRMRNTATGQTLQKTLVHLNGSVLPYIMDYDPASYDAFCFNVEWVGFSTPETFSMDYSHVTDTFTLNAQDAFSTLKYKKFAVEDYPVVSFADTFFEFLKKLGTYRKIYVTDTIKFPDVTGNILAYTYEQVWNNYDEDLKATDQFDTLTQILTYLNLTAIPYKNNLILTTPNAITEGWNNYYVYSLPYNGYIINWPSQGAEYTPQGQEYLTDDYTITQDSFADGGTTISTVNIYNSVNVECDEYDVQLMLPDIEDEDNLSNHFYEYTHGYFFRSGDDRQNWYWEHDFWAVNIPKMKTFQYVGNSYNDSWNTAEQWPPNYTENSGIYYSPTCAILDDGGHTYAASEMEGLQKPYNPTRKIYFRTPSYNSTRGGVENSWQTMLYAKTEDVVFTGSHYLQITGDWSFYNSTNWTFKHQPTIHEISNTMGNAKRANSCCWVRAKVKCCEKWLANSGSGYTWVDNETTVQLKLQTDSTQNAFGVSTPFANTYRNYNGIVVKLPITGDAARVGAVEIWFSRPFGVAASYLCETATLTNFEFNVIPEQDLNRKQRNQTNTSYKTTIDNNAVEEYSDITLKLSSDKDKGTRFSQVIRNGYNVMGNTYNVATGNYHLPEQHVSTNIANQYATPTVNLQMTIHNEITPYTCIQWPRMTNKKFIPDNITINFEYETQDVTITEVKEPNTHTTERRDVTRNYRRNDDLVFNDNRITPPNALTLNNEPFILNGTFSQGNGYCVYDGDETEVGNITLQADFTNCNMRVSIPNYLTTHYVEFYEENGELYVYANGR